MKLEFVKTTKAVSGHVYYFTKADGMYQEGSLSSDIIEAKKKFEELCESAKKFPEEVTEIVESINI